MGRVQEGAFDPGPPPPEVASPREDSPKPREELRDRALRQLREQEAQQAQTLDWYRQLASNSDPGDEAPAMVRAVPGKRAVASFDLLATANIDQYMTSYWPKRAQAEGRSLEAGPGVTITGVDLAEPGTDQTVVMVRNGSEMRELRQEKRIRRMRLVPLDHAPGWELCLEFTLDGSICEEMRQRFSRNASPMEYARGLREMAECIERGMGTNLDRVLARAERVGR